MKKTLDWTKSLLLAGALAVVSYGFLPQSADAASVTIYCDGTNNHCATVYAPGVIIDVDLGNFLGAVLEV